MHPGQRPQRGVVGDVGVGDRAQRPAAGASRRRAGPRPGSGRWGGRCRRPWPACRGRRRARPRSPASSARPRRRRWHGRSRRPAGRPARPSAGRSRSATRTRAAGSSRRGQRQRQVDRVNRQLASHRCRGSGGPPTSVTGVPSGSDCSCASSALNAGTPPLASSRRSFSLAVTQQRGHPGSRGLGVDRGGAQERGSVTWTSPPEPSR